MQDITEWNKDIEVDLIMHGSPCQDFSVAGKQAGGDVGSGTRSSLMYETIRIVGKLRPKYVVWENVKNLLSKKHKHNFDAYIETMNILGYNSYYQVLNAKDYGIPQNRERVFTISIRKDIDKCTFTFPEKEPLKLRLKDMLEEQVDEKYYLSQPQIERIKTTTYNVGKTRIQEKDYCDTLCARDWKDPKCVQIELTDSPNSNVIGNIVMDKWQDHMKRIYDVNSYAPTLGTMQGGNTEPKILEEPSIQVLGNYMPSNHDASRIVDSDGLAPTVKENHGTVTATVVGEKEYERTPLKFLNRNQKNIDGDYAFCVDSCNTGGVKEIEGSNLRIRKLTSKECWRLMGFDDEDFEKAKTALNEKFYKGKDKSSSQLYKQAGNSIVVNVLEKIFKNLLEE